MEVPNFLDRDTDHSLFEENLKFFKDEVDDELTLGTENRLKTDVTPRDFHIMTPKPDLLPEKTTESPSDAVLMPQQVLPQNFRIPPQIDCLTTKQSERSIADLKALLASWGMLQLYDWFIGKLYLQIRQLITSFNRYYIVLLKQNPIFPKINLFSFYRVLPKFHTMNSVQIYFLLHAHLYLAQQLFIDVLAYMDLSQVKLLLVRNGFSEGIQAHFTHHWKIWKSLPRTPNVDQIQATTSIVNTPTKVNSEHQHTEIETNNYSNIESNDDGVDITLTKIFDWGGKMAKELIDSYDKNEKLSEIERATLCEMVINYSLVNDLKLNVSTCRRLASEITAAFPNEIESAYHKPTNGRLITKFNYKQRLKKDKATEKRSASSSFTSIESTKKWRIDDIDDEEMLRAISKLNNDSNLTIDEIKSLWRKTAPNRIGFIVNKAKDFTAVFAKWKQYTEPRGFVFIDMDFTAMFGEIDTLILGMDKFLACFVDFLRCNEHRGFKNETCKKMWKKYNKNISESAKVTIAFHLIHEILKPTSMKSECVDGLKLKSKRSVDDSISAFFHHSTSIDTWNEHVKSSKGSFQPIIAIIGEDILKPSNIFVFLDGIKYCASSMADAIDTCFKVHHVLKIKYPIACLNIWTFIEMWFYKPLFDATNTGRNKLQNANIDVFIGTLNRML